MASGQKNHKKGFWRGLLAWLLPTSLWTRRFFVAWCGSFVTILVFDLLWCVITNYRPLSFFTTYLCAAALAMVMALPSLLSRSRWPQLVALLLFDAWFVANLMYGRTYYEMIPAPSYALVGNVAQFTDSIAASLRWGDILLPLIAIATVGLLPRQKSQFPFIGYFTTFFCLVFVSFLFALSYGGLSAHIAWLKNNAYWHASPPVLYTVPVALAEDLCQGMSQTPQQDIDQAFAIMNERMRLATEYETQYPTESARRDNLVMVIVESLEAWPIGLNVQGQDITPNIDKWLADSTTWFARRVASQVGTGRSIDGQLLMTTGLYPTSRFVYSMEYYNTTYPSLAQELRHTVGANSYFLTGDRANTWNQVLMAKAFGLKNTRFRDSWDCSEYFGHHHNPTDKSLYRQIAESMQAGEIWPEGEKAIVEIVTFSSHHPWHMNPEAKVVTLDREALQIHPLLASYIEIVSYVDSALAQLVDYLKSRSDWHRTMVVIVGDHEALATNRSELRAASPILKEAIDEREYVPMIVLNSPVGGRRDEVMGQIDVYSTILDLMGITPQWTGLGFSAFSPLSPHYAAAPVSQPGAYPLPADTLSQRVRNIVSGQQTAGNAIISADLLKNRLEYGAEDWQK